MYPELERTVLKRVDGQKKGKTENELLKLFKSAYMFHPGYIQPTKGLKNAYKIYSLVAPFYPIWKLVKFYSVL